MRDEVAKADLRGQVGDIGSILLVYAPAFIFVLLESLTYISLVLVRYMKVRVSSSTM